MSGAIKSEVFGGNKKLHEESEGFIKSKLEKYLPYGCQQGNSSVHSIATDVKEVRDYKLYTLIGYNSFELYCIEKLDGAAEWYNGLIDFCDEMGGVNHWMKLKEAKAELTKRQERQFRNEVVVEKINSGMTQQAVAEVVGLSRQGVGKVLGQLKSANAQNSCTQETKAKQNKISRRTQVKIDKIQKVDPELAQKVIAKEIPADTAMRQCGLVKVLSTVEEALNLAKQMSDDEWKTFLLLADKVRAV